MHTQYTTKYIQIKQHQTNLPGWVETISELRWKNPFLLINNNTDSYDFLVTLIHNYEFNLQKDIYY